MRSGKTAGNSIACSFAVTGILFKVQSRSLQSSDLFYIQVRYLHIYVNKEKRINSVT